MISRRVLLSTLLAGAGAAACRLTVPPVPTPTPLATPIVEPTPTAVALPTADAAAPPLVMQPPPVPQANAARRLRGRSISIATVTMGPRVFPDITNALAGRFELDTGIRTRVVPHVLSDALPFYQRLLEAQSPDLDAFTIDVIWPGILAEDCADLGPALGADATQHYAPLVQNGTADGRLVAMPFYSDLGMLYYRTDLLERYGFGAPPRTWAELEAQARTIAAGERRTNSAFAGFVYQGSPTEGLTCNALEWLASSGGGHFVDEGRVTINNAEASDILNRIRSWTGTIAPSNVTSFVEEDARTAFQTGSAAFMRNWVYAFALGNAADSPIKGKFAVAPLPSATGQTPVATEGGWDSAVSRYSQNVDAAIEWVRYGTGPEPQVYRSVLAGTVPTMPAVTARPEVIQPEPFIAAMQGVTRVVRPSNLFGQRYTEASTLIFQGVNQILNGQDTNLTLAELQRKLEALLPP